jgi:lipopolysaccharide transport system ATP-binding protein
MSTHAIAATGLGKQYRLGQREPYGSLRDAVAAGLSAPFGRKRVSSPDESKLLWALRDVSLTVDEGEVIGVVGRNGAGKSTLLKILSRITSPTTGEARIRGRVGSLLEVGTGFHPELTGRENIFLNGAILGMRSSEIKRKFDEIVAFAEVERFIDTPVKRYSSGMYVRLAFSVAAHLEPEVLLVDEVLAVGDVAFQRKCLGRMGRVASEGRTVLFVSHNLGAIKQLCPRSVLLSGGEVVLDADTDSVLQRYVDSDMTDRGGVITADMVSGATDMLEFRDVRLLDGDVGYLRPGDPIKLEIRLRALETLREARLNVGVSTLLGERLFSVSNVDDQDGEPVTIEQGDYTVSVALPGILRGGVYHVGIGGHRDGPGQWWTWVPNALRLEIQDEHPLHYNLGSFRVEANWVLERD